MKYGVSFFESILKRNNFQKIIDQICNCNVCNVLQKNVSGFGLKIWPSYRRAHSSPPILMLTQKEIIGPKLKQEKKVSAWLQIKINLNRALWGLQQNTEKMCLLKLQNWF